MQVDFLAREAYYVDHLAPIWNELPSSERGSFYCLGAVVQEYAAKKLLQGRIKPYIDEEECGVNPIITASYGDAVRAIEQDPTRLVIMMEHGVGLTFGKAAYANGTGERYRFSMIPVQSQYVQNKVHPELAHIPHPIIGVPKLDRWFTAWNSSYKIPTNPVIAFTFHHGNKLSRPAEVGSAWEHYIDLLPELDKKYNLLVHVHPSSAPVIKETCSLHGLKVVSDYEQVFKTADILINDCGSAAYEFCTTGRPVILLNAPWFNQNASYGIRFWDYTNIGIQVDDPGSVEQAIKRTIIAPDEYRVNRRRMVHDLFPHFGVSTLAAISAIRDHLEKNRSKIKQFSFAPKAPMSTTTMYKPVRSSKNQGIIYMSFGSNAAIDMIRSIETLRNTGSTLPIAAVTDKGTIKWARETKIPEKSITWIEWKGQNPFDVTKNSHFQFRAGRVKPFLFYNTPFKQTMYVDTDTEFLMRPDEAFGFLKNWDFVVAQERLLLSQLYNKRGAGWEHDIAERDATIKAFNACNGDFPFWNSGVFFWRDNKAVEQLFKLWYEEWLVFQGWDEQKALMRAGNRSKVKILVLGEIWNFPHRSEIREQVHESARIILHEYGRGSSRIDIKEEV